MPICITLKTSSFRSKEEALVTVGLKDTLKVKSFKKKS